MANEYNHLYGSVFAFLFHFDVFLPYLFSLLRTVFALLFWLYFLAVIVRVFCTHYLLCISFAAEWKKSIWSISRFIFHFQSKIQTPMCNIGAAISNAIFVTDQINIHCGNVVYCKMLFVQFFFCVLRFWSEHFVFVLYFTLTTVFFDKIWTEITTNTQRSKCFHLPTNSRLWNGLVLAFIVI